MNKMEIAIARIQNYYQTYTDAYHAIMDPVKGFGFKSFTSSETSALLEIAALWFGIKKTKKERMVERACLELTEAM